MYFYIKKYFFIILIFVLVSLPASATNISSEIKEFSKNMSTQELIQEAKNQQCFISKYLKKHTKEQNLELFLTWEKNINNVVNNRHDFSSGFEKYPNDEYIKDLQAQFSKTGIVPSYNYTNSEYVFSIDYINGNDLFGKNIPNDWSLYLKYLSIEQANNFTSSLEKNEKCLAMWEYFILTFPNFEQNWIVYNKIKKYENAYFISGVFKEAKNGANIYKDEVVLAYDKFSNKYPASKYATICTRLSNLKKLKHGFISPYNELFANIELSKHTYFAKQHLKNTVKNNAKYVYDINNNIWVKYSDEYIRGNYLFLANDPQKNLYKIYNNTYTLISNKEFPQDYNFDSLFLKNGRLFLYNQENLTMEELKYNSSNQISFVPLTKENIETLYQGTSIIHLSSLTKNQNEEYQIKIKCKKYPKKYLIYNDKTEKFTNHKFEVNPNIKFISRNEIEVNAKTTLKFEPEILTNINEDNLQSEGTTDEDTELTENNKKEIKSGYIFIFE